MVTGSSQGGKAHGETGESHILGLQRVSGLMLPQGQTQPVPPSQSPHSQHSLLTLPSFSSFHLPFSPPRPPFLPDEEVHPRSASLRLTNTNIPTKEMQSISLDELFFFFFFFFLKRYALPAAAPTNAQRKSGRFSHSLERMHTFSLPGHPFVTLNLRGKRVTFVYAAMRASAGTAANKRVPRPAECRALT